MGGWRSRVGVRGTALALVGAFATACGSQPGPAPDVLLITWDTVRADHVGAAAAPEHPYADAAIVATPPGPSPTPRLDALARDGVSFSEARSPVPITLPAHASLLTGLHPPHHGVRDNGQFRLAEAVPTLTERFARAGYATGAFVSSAALARSFGLARGFERYDDTLGEKAGNRSLASRRADSTVSEALGWLASLPAEQPFLLWVHLFAPHRPWRAPEPFAERFDPYRAEIAFSDAQTGRLLDALADAGRLERALVVVTSDHGEGLGEHGEGTHSYFAYDSTLRVPLVFWAGAAAGPLATGRRVAGPASLVDVAPTLLAWAGLEPTPTDGRSLLAALRGDAPVAPRRMPFESVVPALDYATAPLFGVLDEHDSAWIDAPRRERYDLARDPTQRENLYRATDADAADAVFAGIDRDWPPRSAPLALDEETRLQLEALGYASDAGTPAGEPSGVDPKDRVALFEFKSLGAEGLGLEDTLARLDALQGEYGPVLALARFRADTLVALGRHRAAIGALEQAAREHPEATFLPVQIAKLRRQREQQRELEAAIRHALAQNPDHPTAERDLALTLHQLEEWEEASALYERRLGREPTDDETRANLARLLHSRGAPEAALAALDAGRARADHDPELDCLAGRLLAESLDRPLEALPPLRACRAGGGRLSARGREILGRADPATATGSTPAAPAP